MKFVITGGCGFLGTNLGLEVLRRGHQLVAVDNLSRTGAVPNLELLRTRGPVHYRQLDVRNLEAVEGCIKDEQPDVVFHLAGQVAMTTSIADPRADFEINVLGGHNVLESVRRHAPHATMVFSSTNKVYGSMLDVALEETPTRYIAPLHPQGFSEELPLSFESPYGCSKGAMDQYMLDYARIFQLKTVVFRHSSIYGTRQFSTFDQGWVGWFVAQALAQRSGTGVPFTISGDGKQVRDLLCAPDLVSCYFAAVEHIEEARGQAFNIGGGMPNSFSLLELFAFLEAELGIALRYQKLAERQSDQKVFVADTAKARRLLHWEPTISREHGVRTMMQWVGELAEN